MAKFSDMINQPIPVLIDFSAEWCGPCKTLQPILKEVKNKVSDKVIIYKIDIDKNPALAQQYAVQSVPTLILFMQGNEVWRNSGVIPGLQLVKVLEKYAADAT